MADQDNTLAQVNLIDEYVKETSRVFSEIKRIHWARNGYCNECGGNFPCLTMNLVIDCMRKIAVYGEIVKIEGKGIDD